MPRSYRSSRTPRRLSQGQKWELLRGPNPARGEAFASDEERRRAYFNHEVELRLATNANHRPWGFWEYVVGRHPDVYADERAPGLLAELGLLGGLEREAMALPWRQSVELRRESILAEVERR